MNWILTLLTAATEAASETAQQSTSMDTIGMLDILLMVMLFGCGIYSLYTVIKLRRTYYLEPNKFLYPANCKPEDCLDADGFIDYILPKLTICGILWLLSGIAFAVNNYVLKFEGWLVYTLTIIVPVAPFVWYMFIQRKSAKEFWGV